MSPVLIVSDFWSPKSIPGLKLWLDASRIGLNDGDPIAQWDDLSGNGNHATQATPANRPLYKVNIINGRPVVRFDGSDDSLSAGLAVAVAQPCVVFFVFARTASTVTHMVWSNDSVQSSPYCFFSSPGNQMKLESTAGTIIGTDWGVTFAVGEAILNGASSELLRNGAVDAAGNVGTGGLTGLRLGIFFNNFQYFAAIDMPEFLLYNHIPSGSERRRLRRYFGVKYAIAVS